LEVKPAYLEGIGRSQAWNFAINGKLVSSWENKLSPGKYNVKLSHRCYEDISFDAGINKDKREIFEMSGHVKLKLGGLVLSAEKDDKPVSEPVFVDGKQVGETPYSGSVPVCSDIKVGEEKVNVKLEYKQTVRHLHKVQLNRVLADARDGKKYKVAKIGSQIWMAENLNYDVSGSKCHDNNPANCERYGRLYDWKTAMNVCPAGWHLPSKSEWEQLAEAVGGEKVAGKRLKARSGWGNSGNGTDDYSFSALPGGYGLSDGTFYFIGYLGNWWSTSESSSDIVYIQTMHYEYEDAYWGNSVKSNLYNVRCLQDAHSPSVLEISSPPVDTVPAVILPPAGGATPVAEKKCEKTININELVLKVENEFPKQLKDCSAALAKNMALAMSPFGKKTEQKEPKAFMMECTIDGVKQKLPEGYVKPVEVFLQSILDAASAGGSFDVKKLAGAVGGMDIGGLLGGIRKLAAEDSCAVDEPYEPSVAAGGEEGEVESKEGKRKVFSWGLRGGYNVSNLYAEYSNNYTSASGNYKASDAGQFGLVFDWALNDWLHLQPGIMYILKSSTGCGGHFSSGPTTTSYMGCPDFGYIEIPLLLSLKFSVLRINAGPYFGFLYDSFDVDESSSYDFGLSAGLGFDIGKFSIFGFGYGFYIGTFYDYGLTESFSYRYNDSHLKAYNRTLGFDLGVNFL
jgi:uncharacterized protein (TIGR02145 family)